MTTKIKRCLASLTLLCATMLPSALFLRTAFADELAQPRTNELPALPTRIHTSYISGYPDGTMQPNKACTRAEAVSFVYRLLGAAAEASENCSYLDVADGDWYATSVRALYSLGFLTDSQEFRPNDAITRAEFVSILAHLSSALACDSAFSDVPADHWAAKAINTAAALGWVGGYKDGSFQPEQTLTRAEACAIINRLSGREGDNDMASALLSLGLYSDVSASHWAGAEIVEASVSHTSGNSLLSEEWNSLAELEQTFSPGIHEVNGTLYAVDRNGHLILSQKVGAYEADACGRLSQKALSYAEEVPYISQLDNIDADMGCEPISALMGLRGKGFALDISVDDFLDNLPYSESNPAEGFVGSPYYSDGRYSSIDPQPLADYCNTVCGSNLCADISGYSLEEVQRELLAGNYIVAYQTFWWKPVSYADFLIDGDLTSMVSNNHVRLICGYDPERGYLVSDPYNYYEQGRDDQYWVASGFFEYSWNERKKGMVIR